MLGKKRGARLDRSNPVEATMQKTTLAILGALLISGMAVPMATAGELFYYGHKAYFGRDFGPPPSSAPSSVLSRAYNSYNQMNGPDPTPPPRLDRLDQSNPGGGEPTLNSSRN